MVQELYSRGVHFAALPPITFHAAPRTTPDASGHVNLPSCPLGIKLSDVLTKNPDALLDPHEAFWLSTTSQKITYRLRVSHLYPLSGP